MYSTKSGGILDGSVSSQGLQSGQGIPGGPQVQALSPSQGRSGWASRTQSIPWQHAQTIASPETKKPQALGRELEADASNGRAALDEAADENGGIHCAGGSAEAGQRKTKPAHHKTTSILVPPIASHSVSQAS
jgi:hypothetical protein